uniref:Uncharacterized protein n=1 Tax=Hanusia phi TaxID=3032 RepID=A0A7S0HYT0_9CRYP
MLLLTVLAIMLLEAACADECCSKQFEPNQPCDPDHWCNFVFQEEYEKMSVIGGTIFAVVTGISILWVLSRDVFRLWGAGKKGQHQIEQ